MASEATLVIIKPDAISRGLVGSVYSRLETLGLEVIGAKAVRVSKSLAEEHYKHIRSKPFFQETIDYIRGKLHGTDAVLALVLWGPEAIARVRQIIGATDPEKAAPETIRAGWGRNRRNGLMENVLHSSSDLIAAEHEIGLWFAPEELTKSLHTVGQRTAADTGETPGQGGTA